MGRKECSELKSITGLVAMVTHTWALFRMSLVPESYTVDGRRRGEGREGGEREGGREGGEGRKGGRYSTHVIAVESVDSVSRDERDSP